MNNLFILVQIFLEIFNLRAQNLEFELYISKINVKVTSMSQRPVLLYLGNGYFLLQLLRVKGLLVIELFLKKQEHYTC